MRVVSRGLIGAVVFFLLWEALCRVGGVSPSYLPPPTQVLTGLVGLGGNTEFLLAVVATVLSTVIATAIAVAIAVPAGLLLGSIPVVRKAVEPIVEFLRPIPSVALIPLSILVLGGGVPAKIVLGAFAATWPILVNAVYGLEEVDTVVVDTARSFGLNRLRVLLRVELPSAGPFVFTGIRLSIVVALVVVLSTELLAGASGGLGGFVLQVSSGGGHQDQVLAGAVVAGVIGYVINTGLERMHRRMFPWSESRDSAP
jgi:NitT/TauT family transport system permease protein